MAPLCFVTVLHEYSTPRGTVIREMQYIVYRDAASAENVPSLAVFEIPEGA